MKSPLLTHLLMSMAWLACSPSSAISQPGEKEIDVLLLSGRSNKYHSWEGTEQAILNHLEAARIFEVDLLRTTPTGESLDDFAPNWDDYQAVVLNWEGEEWPEATKAAFLEYMRSGGGLVLVHSANNTFPHWLEFNEMIGLGGWGGAGLHQPPLYPGDPSRSASRDESWGPRVHWRGCQAVRDSSPGKAHHPPRHEFLVTVRTPDHPITKGLPEMWLQSNDEIYSGLRGPAKNLTVLATGFADPSQRNASPYNEPLLMTIDYEKGRVFQTTLGHVGAKDDENVPAANDVAFITTLQRGTEWAATGQVSLSVPDDFPHAYQNALRPPPSQGWTPLLDPTLSQWEIFMGVPHSSVLGLPEGTHQADKVTEGEPLGLNNDPKNVFTTRQDNGETILHITGEIYGGLTSLESFGNYHFQTQFRWGEQKWAPRLQRKRDSGILYHCQGEHGAFWEVWKSSLECQVQESDIGDFITLAGTEAQAPYRKLEKRSVYDPSEKFQPWKGYLHAEVEPDHPHGEWNTIDLYVLGDQAIHVVNGKIVMSLKDARGPNGERLSSGQIQIQSEAAEIEYRRMRLRPIKAIPELLRQRAKL